MADEEETVTVDVAAVAADADAEEGVIINRVPVKASVRKAYALDSALMSLTIIRRLLQIKLEPHGKS